MEEQIQTQKEVENLSSGPGTGATKIPASYEVPTQKRTIIEEAREAANELRQLNEEKKELLRREEELIARKEALREMGGDSFAGQRVDNRPRELSPIEYRQAIERGEIPQKVINN